MKVLLIFSFFLTGNPAAMAKASIVTLNEVVKDWETLQVVDARSLDEFRKDHIPGAIHMDWRQYRHLPSTVLENVFGPDDGQVLSDPKKLEEVLSQLGIREDLPILVYGGKSRWGEEGRIAWNLLYWGASDVRLLDGGWETWSAKRPKLMKKNHPVKKFSVKLISDRRIDFGGMKQIIAKKRLIIDVRSSSEVRAGKIPNATHFLDELLYKKDGTFPQKNELEAILPELSSAQAFYCAGGVRSALAAILVEARLGVRMKNYDGSMWDWRKKAPGE